MAGAVAHGEPRLSQQKEMPRPLVIGVAGPTRAGKSTLCRGLAAHLRGQAFKVTEIHQDYFLRGGETPDQVDWRSFLKDIRRALDGQQISSGGAASRAPVATPSPPSGPAAPSSASASARSTSPVSGRRTRGRAVVIVEGFLLYSNPDVVRLCDMRLCLTLSQATCHARRRATKRTGLAGNAFDQYFVKTIWASYVAHGQYAFDPAAAPATPAEGVTGAAPCGGLPSVPAVVPLDGEASVEAVLRAALNVVGPALAARRAAISPPPVAAAGGPPLAPPS